MRCQVKRKLDGVLVPYELTGCSIHLQARKNVVSDKVLLDASTASGDITITDEDEGRFELNLTAAQTSKLCFGKPHTQDRAVFHCEVSPTNGDDFRVLEGTITLDPEVVR